MPAQWFVHLEELVNCPKLLMVWKIIRKKYFLDVLHFQSLSVRFGGVGWDRGRAGGMQKGGGRPWALFGLFAPATGLWYSTGVCLPLPIDI